MVHALEEVHRVLVSGGVLVDARPDSRVLAHVQGRTLHGYETFGTVNTSRDERANDRVADGAIARVVRSGLFKSRRRGRFWHRVPFDDLGEVRAYLRDHLRFVHRARWIVDSASLRRHASDRFVIRRAIRYEVFKSI